MDTRTTQYLFAAAIFFFIGWAILSGVSDHDMFFDRLYGAGEVFLVYLFWRKYRFSTLQLGLIGAAIFLHQIKLYGNTYFGVEFDTYMHVVATFAIACLLASVIAQSLKPQHHHWLLRAFIVFTATVGIATTVEPIEYLGYATLGEGDGILLYGAGDGGWRDTAEDIAANMAGSLAALVFMFSTEKFKLR